MGLDQWIYKKEYNDVYNDEGELVECHDTSMIYWRKCNQIHSWFDNLVGGVENCEDYPVTIKDLEKLRDDCKWVLNDRSMAGDILPVMRGCFFGGYDYDEYYFEQLEYTVKELDFLLSVADESDEFYYHSWW